MAIDQVTAIMRYEQGDATARETVELFADLVRTGLAWSLQGHYGRTAHGMIRDGIIRLDGTIDEERYAAVLED